MNKPETQPEPLPPAPGSALWSDIEVIRAVNEACSCGGRGPNESCCQACEVWHKLLRARRATKMGQMTNDTDPA